MLPVVWMPGHEYAVRREKALGIYGGEAGSLIESKKQEEFQITYQDGEYLYLLRGYGRQKTGGYSIQVEELSLFAESIFFRTSLVGPAKEDEPSLEPSYPYIVVKLEYRDAPVQFDG